MRHKALLFLVLPFLLLAGLAAAPAVVSEKDQINHVLNRIAFGARPGDVERVQKMGIRKYIEQQLHPETIDDSDTAARLKSLTSLGLDVSDVFRRYPQPQQLARQMGLLSPKQGQTPEDQAELSQKLQGVLREKGLQPPQQLLQELIAQKVVRAVSSERQLQEVMTDFWFNHFNVYWAKGADRWLTTDFEMNAIRPNAMGKFKDLLMATAKSPAMLFYLDNFLSSSPDMKRLGPAKRKRQPGINENYARELMELHTMGVDSGYTQKDIQEVARAFTGWSIDAPRRGGGQFMFRPRMHDSGQKAVLGHKINAGGVRDGELVLE